MKLFSGKLGADASVEIDMAQGVVSLHAVEETAGLKVQVTATLPLTYYVDASAQKLNSPIVGMVASLLDAALKTVN